jgi:hypothetical protein
MRLLMCWLLVVVVLGVVKEAPPVPVVVVRVAFVCYKMSLL